MKRAMIITAVSAVTAIGSVLFYLSTSHNTLNVNCQSFIIRDAEGGDFLMKANYIFDLKKNGKGVIYGEGEVNYKNKKYLLRRQAEVSFSHVNGNIWQFTGLKEFKEAADTTPDEVYAKDFYLTDEKSGRYFTVKDFGDHVFIGSLRMSAFLCTKV